MMAWEESPECWHAVAAAIPFMHLAKSVRVISVDRDASNRQASQAEVLAYLRCHGIGATAQVVAPELRSVGDTLLAAGIIYLTDGPLHGTLQSSEGLAMCDLTN